MQPHDHPDVVARVDGIEARVLAGSAGVQDALGLLDRVEREAGVPLVDEAERARLESLASGTVTRGDHWHSVLARRVDATETPSAVGYAALQLPPASLARGDVAIDRGCCAEGLVLSAMLRACEALGRRHEAPRLQVWVRHVTDADVRHATTAGWCVDRRLGVLSRSLHDLRWDGSDEGFDGSVVLDTFRDDDADDVVTILAAAYEGTPDGGWTRQRFDEKRSFAWFDPADLLVARHTDGHVRGIHWTKRRGGSVGEVYNLAVHPDAQGRRLGALLLAAGLRHLRDQGCTSALLWVDLANERAVRLYAALGFTVAWEDVALGREIVAPTDQSSTSRLRSVSGTSL